uniref:Uncharacterized protein n=2 Tax=Octopus bimaculoides TaxID=37653 RepID=A0A0L8FMM7_OCTBM
MYICLFLCSLFQEFPKTSYQEQCQQLALKPFCEQRSGPAPMVNENSFGYNPWQRDTGAPEEGFGSILPHHPKPHPKNYFQTFYNINYTPPFPYESQPSKTDLEYLTEHRKCHSQFTDTADYRRFNLNTWQNDSGIYAKPRKPKEKTLDGLM